MAKTKKWIITRVICVAVMTIFTVAIIIGDIFATAYANIITSFLSGTGEDFDAATASLKGGDELCIQLAEDSIVLLRNERVAGDKNALPLDSGVTALNVFGYGATDTGFLLKGIGSGSSTIDASKQLTLIDALTGKVRDIDIDEAEYKSNGYTDTDLLAQLKKEYSNTLVKYEVNQDILDIYNKWNKSNARPHMNELSINDNSGKPYRLDEPSTSLFTDSIMNAAAEKSDVAIFVVSRDGGENIGEQPTTQTVGGRTVSDRTYMDLTTQEEDMLKLLDQYFGTTILILNTTNMMHLGFLKDKELGIDACLYVGLLGQSGARAVPEILSGKINPSGKTTDIATFSSAVAKEYDPTYANHAASGGQIHYVEDIYYGYKWYETADADGYFAAKGTTYDNVVAYPFGYGLSYTKFDQELLEIYYNDAGGNKVTLGDNAALDGIPVNTTLYAEVRVTNSGKVAGKDIVQLYYTPEYKKGGLEKAAVNLLAFTKTGIIDPAASHTVTVKFTPYDMASYDCYGKNSGDHIGYELESGSYAIKLMSNSHDTIASRTYTLAADVNIDNDPVTNEKVTNRFTGETAYAGVGSDGAEAGVPQKWLSRNDFAGTFPKTRSTGYSNGSKVNSAANYMNNAPYENLDLNLTENGNGGLYMWTVEGTGAKATADQLSGEDTSVSIAPNYELFETLLDYKATEWTTILNQLNKGETKKLVELGGFQRLATESVGLRKLYDYDGPAGFNGESRGSTGKWTAYESEALIGCSWNENLMFLMGRSMGNEGNETIIQGWYAPGVNLHRSNYNSRNFEYYSEDAVLSGRLAVQVIAGAKTNGLTCYLKHFACSEEGPNPQRVNTWITEQNLRENYLRPFEIAVKGIDIDLSATDEEGNTTHKTIHVGANGIMTAFNRVGASWAGANYAMNVNVLREEWGFKGTVITDYTVVNSAAVSWGSDDLGNMYTRQGVRGGNDLYLDPLSSSRSLNVNDKIDMYCARQSVKNILYTVADTMTTYKTVVDSGAQLDKYQTTLSDKFKNVTAWWIPVLISVEVVVFLGFIVWAVFLFVPVKHLIKKRKAAKAAKAGAASTDGNGVNVDAIEATDGTVVGEESAETAESAETPDTSSDTVADETVQTPSDGENT